MGRKSAGKQRNQSPGGPPHAPEPRPAGAPSRSGPSPLVLGVVLLAVVGVGILAFWRPTGDAPASSSEPAETASTATAGAASAAPTADATARAETLARLGPRKHATLPPIPFQVGYQPPRSEDVITAAYRFAADHPEILSYVPCFCGCERSGHQGNHDCFVKQRADNGDVVEWDPHGVDCAVCIDVANRSRQMHAAGASVRDIRAAIDKEFGTMYPTGRNMATPHPSHGTH